MNNTLIFEGAGWDRAEAGIKSGVGNCRIRTRIKNNDGRLIYLEMGGIMRNKYTKSIYDIIGRIDHLHYADVESYDYHDKRRGLSRFEGCNFEYNKDNILDFVNSKLNCNYTDIEVISSGLRVHDTDKAIC